MGVPAISNLGGLDLHDDSKVPTATEHRTAVWATAEETSKALIAWFKLHLEESTRKSAERAGAIAGCSTAPRKG